MPESTHTLVRSVPVSARKHAVNHSHPAAPTAKRVRFLSEDQ